MMHRKPVTAWTALVLGLLPFLSCTDAVLYDRKDPFQASKLTVSGTVCTDDPHQRNFPVKILFMIDTSTSLIADSNDPFGNRGKAVEEIVGLWGKSPNYHFGVLAYGPKARNLVETGFTRDSALLDAAIASVKGSGGIAAPGGCIGGRCRDLRAAFSLASSIITGDVLGGDPGEVARTTYVLVLFAGGPPVPAMGRCACRDKGTEEKLWGTCKWNDCEGCKVTCPPSATCEDYTCFPVCSPGCRNDQYCDTDYLCKEGSPSGRPTVEPISVEPVSLPDTFSQQLKPPAAGGACPKPSGASDPSLCVYNASTGTGNSDSCEERTMVALVRELKDFAKKNGAAQLQLHTTYLADKEPRQASDPWFPPCSVAADEARSIRLLSEMAYAGDGSFEKFGGASAISFRGLDLHTTRDPLVIKELVATNLNVQATAAGNEKDSDADGLTDAHEELLKTCPRDEDTDGDGVGDAVELRLAFDPLTPGERIECVDLLSSSESGDDPCMPGQEKKWRRFKDKDGDGLNACEERLLGTSDSLMDSDADGLPDKVEFVAGTNYLAVDHLVDSDMDGIVNREELRGHTDPRSNDSQKQLDLAYRYEEVDEGVRPILSFTQPSTLTGITIKNISAASGTGLGYLRYSPGPPPTLSWKDPEDMQAGGDFGPAVDISRMNNDGYQLLSCRKGATDGCAPESADRYLTVLVEGDGTYPLGAQVDTIVVSSAMRNCLRFRVRNITLMETDVHRILGTPGNNNVKIYFSEAPRNAKEGYGIFRVRDIQLNYRVGPPETRTPRDAEITIADDDFTIRE